MTELIRQLSASLAGRYAIQRELGAGGMAVVFLAEDLKHHRPVAIKVLKPELASVVGPERFLREIEVAARLQHPHILPLLDSGRADGLLYYVMPYVEGESLRTRLDRERQLPVKDALRLAEDVAAALDYAHRRGVVHRDIKPENILLADGQAVVADFGIARAVVEAGGAKLTETGITLGTPLYMSPEQATGSRDLDGRSDVYSLACVLYEMLAGQPPFTGPTSESVVHQHLNVEPRSVSELRPTVPAGITQPLRLALAKTPADRYETAARFAEALALQEPTAPGPARTAAKASRARRPRRLVWLVAAAVVVTAGTLLVLRPGRRAQVPAASPTHARTEIAVLPFQNLSGEGPHAYFAGGLQDELLTQLSKVSTLKVISRTSVMSYRGTTMPPLRQIATELGVGSIVEGSVQVVGGRLRVNVQLIDASTDEHLWAESYDRTLDDAFAIQSEVAQRIVAGVDAILSSAERGNLTTAPTSNAEAYRLYLQGRDYWTRPGKLPENYKIAQQLYERALTLDPSFALAHAALSQLHGMMYWIRYDASPARADRQRREAETALRLAPDLPEAHMAMGSVHYLGRRDYRKALEEYVLALERMPNDAELWRLIGSVQRRLGDWDEVVAAFEKAARLNPRQPEVFADLGGATYRFMRRYPEAIHAYDQALSLAPDLYSAALARAWCYFSWQGQLDTVRTVLNRLPANATILGSPPAMDRADLWLWERNADSLVVKSSAVPAGWAHMYVAWGHQLRGDRNAARAACDSAYAVLDPFLREAPKAEGAHFLRGMALAGLGHRTEALQEARWLRQSAFYREDAFFSPGFKLFRALILAHCLDADAAIDEIEGLMADPGFIGPGPNGWPSGISASTMLRFPLWDPIRNHARFKALVAKSGSGSAG